MARNATAQVLVERGPSLGIVFDRKNGPRLRDEDARLRLDAGLGGWLQAQLVTPDDAIGEPPAALRRLLEERRDALAEIVEALERQPPEWAATEASEDGSLPYPEILPSINLHRVLLAAALVDIRDGRGMDAERLLEASWSLARPQADLPWMLHQLVALAAGRWQAGVLRKSKDVSFVWLGRLSGEEPWKKMVDSVTERVGKPQGDLGDLWTELDKKAPAAIADGLRKLSPCEAANLDEEQLWHLVERELTISSQPEADQIRAVFREVYLPNVHSIIRRAARLAVDRELTLQIVRLRLAKTGDPDERWPAKLVDTESVVCPSAVYEYRSDETGMEIRLSVVLPDPETPFVLPLAFRSDYPKPPAKPKPGPPLTPTPPGGMMPPR